MHLRRSDTWACLRRTTDNGCRRRGAGGLSTRIAAQAVVGRAGLVDGQEQAEGVGDDEPLAALQFLARVEAPGGSRDGVGSTDSHRLASIKIDGARRIPAHAVTDFVLGQIEEAA